MKPSLFSFALLTAFYIVSSPFAVAGVSFGTPITSRTPNPAFLTPIGPVIIDADSDGNADIVTADFSGNARYISYGNADGSARSSLTYAEPNQPYAMASADLNADGLPDLIFSSGGAIQYYLSENGSYQFRRELASPALFPVSLVRMGSANGVSANGVRVRMGSVCKT